MIPNEKIKTEENIVLNFKKNSEMNHNYYFILLFKCIITQISVWSGIFDYFGFVYNKKDMEKFIRKYSKIDFLNEKQIDYILKTLK